ncbi:MAG: 8-oxoguanine deaminase [Pseudomonadota bacterium]
MRRWIRNATAIWTGTGERFAGIVTEGPTIVELLSAGAEPSKPVTQTVDASDCVVLPGLVNCHHHFYQTLTRAVPTALNKPLFPWLQALYPVWSGLTATSIEVSTRLALAELMLSGCSLSSDHHYVFTDALSDAIDIQASIARDIGVRVALTRGSMSLSEDEGGLPPATVVQNEATILAESERLLNAWHDPANDALCRIALAPCSPFSVTAGIMRDSAELARRFQARLHTHLAETEDENAFCAQHYGQRPLDLLADLGWLADDVWLAHGIHFDMAEVHALGAAGVAISHCPSSNMVLASGTCPVVDLETAGCAVGLGVDGSASNDASNLMQEVRQAFLLQRSRYGAGVVSHDDALRWATRGGAATLGWSKLGVLEVGALADLSIWDLNELRFSGVGDPVAALVLSGAHRVRDLLVHGEWRVWSGAIPDLDLERLTAQHQAEAYRLRSAQLAG